MDPHVTDDVSEKDILEFAIDIERQAVKLYSAAAETTTDPKARGLLKGLAAEEVGHEKRLLDLLRKATEDSQLSTQPQPSTIQAYKDIVSGDPLPPNPTVEQIAKFGIEREKATMDLYLIFSHLLAAGAFSELLEKLAQEESRHVDRFEELISNEAGLGKEG